MIFFTFILKYVDASCKATKGAKDASSKFGKF